MPANHPAAEQVDLELWEAELCDRDPLQALRAVCGPVEPAGAALRLLEGRSR